MGRDAFFNTGLERRFTFAVQESSDIRLFGGVNVTSGEDLARENYRHKWSADRDARDVLTTLQGYVRGSGLALPDFSSFSEDLDGTHKLRYWLHTKSRDYISWMGRYDYHSFELGCLIYHQLKYMPELEAHYEP